MLTELQILGLSKNEARIYEALVRYGPCRAGLLISKLEIHRNLVYQSLDSLVSKGHATRVIKEKVWYFQITDPNSYLTTLRQKETIAQQIVKEIKSYQHKTSQQIVVYEGLESYRNFWLSSLERMPEGSVDYCAGTVPTNQWIELMGPAYKKYLKIRLKKKIIWNTLIYQITDAELQMLKEYPNLSEFRVWPLKINCLGNFNVIHDTVILHAMPDPPRIIEIRDPDMVKIFRNYFEMMWSKSGLVSI